MSVWFWVWHCSCHVTSFLGFSFYLSISLSLSLIGINTTFNVAPSFPLLLPPCNLLPINFYYYFCLFKALFHLAAQHFNFSHLLPPLLPFLPFPFLNFPSAFLLILSAKREKKKKRKA